MEITNEVLIREDKPQGGNNHGEIRSQSLFLDRLHSTIVSFCQSHPKKLAAEIEKYQKGYLFGEALSYYEKPGNLTEALKIVKDDDFVVFLRNLKPPLSNDIIRELLGYIEGQGCVVRGFASVEKAQKFVRDFNGYSPSLDYLREITMMATFKADYTKDNKGVKRITAPPEERKTAILINENNLHVSDLVAQLVGLAHEMGHVSEVKNIRGNRVGAKTLESEPQPVTEYIAGLYGMIAAIVSYELGADIDLAKKAFLSNLLIFTNSIGEITHFEEFIRDHLT